MDRVKHPQKLADAFGEPGSRDVSFVCSFDGWPDDLTRLYASVERCVRGSWEVVVIDNPGDDAASGRIAALQGVSHIPLRDAVGFAAGRNLGMRLARGVVVVVVDTSVELTGDPLPALERHLSDPHVGLVGRWGVTTSDGFDFEPSEGPDVDGVEAYLMAMRREVASEVGGFNKRFRWYRNADLDYSFQLRASGYRTLVDASLPVRRHEHRLWSATPEAERDELSRKNFFRFRDHWGDRTDLFVALD